MYNQAQIQPHRLTKTKHSQDAHQIAPIVKTSQTVQSPILHEPGLDTTCPTVLKTPKISPKPFQTHDDHPDPVVSQHTTITQTSRLTHANTSHGAAHHAVSKTIKNSLKTAQNSLNRKPLKPPGLHTQNRQQQNKFI